MGYGYWLHDILYFKYKPKNIVIVVFLAIIAVIFTVVHGGAYSISKFSQNIRLINILKANNIILDENTAKPLLNVSKPKRTLIPYCCILKQAKAQRFEIYTKKFRNYQTKDVFGFKLE